MLELYDIADHNVKPKRRDPQVVICLDEFGPLNLMPRPGKQWAPVITKGEARLGTHDDVGAGPPSFAPQGSAT